MRGGERFGGDRGMTPGRRVETGRADTRDEATRARDSLIRASMIDPESSADLHRESPVTWLRDAVAIDTQRWASQVSDDELAKRYVGGGKYEWDPYVSRKVASYLRSVGFTLVP